MLFNLERDTGGLIEGYVVPDGYSEQSGICVVENDEIIFETDCDQHREAVVASGRHQTGLIGFRLDNKVLPDLEARKHLAIFDRKTGLLIYRRRPREEIVDLKIVRLEDRLNTFFKLDKQVDPYFQYVVSGVERFGTETALQAFHLNAVNSIYISGRLHIKNYEDFFERGFQAVAMLNDPYEELADRLILLQRFAHLPAYVLGERDRMSLAPVVAHFSGVDLNSPKSLNKALKSSNEAVRRVLSSPLTRQLATSYPEQAVNRMSVAQGIDMLSRFAIVGLRERPESFLDPLAEMIGIPNSSLPQPAIHSAVSDLARALRESREAEILLEFDLILYHFASRAILAQASVPFGQTASNALVQ